MAYCTQTLGGITLDCTNSMGGIKSVWVGNYGDINGQPTLDETTGEINQIDFVSGKTFDTVFKPYQFRKQTGSMSSTLTADETTGVNFVTTELSLVFTKMEKNKRLELTALSIGQLVVIVEDCNGEYYYLGYDDYVSTSAGGGNTGTSKTDSNAYTLTLKDESTTYPYLVNKTYMQTLLGIKV